MVRRVGLTAAATFVLALTALMPAVRAAIDRRVQDASVCWVPDVEFPVPCDDDDD